MVKEFAAAPAGNLTHAASFERKRQENERKRRMTIAEASKEPVVVAAAPLNSS